MLQQVQRGACRLGHCLGWGPSKDDCLQSQCQLMSCGAAWDNSFLNVGCWAAAYMGPQQRRQPAEPLLAVERAMFTRGGLQLHNDSSGLLPGLGLTRKL